MRKKPIFIMRLALIYLLLNASMAQSQQHKAVVTNSYTKNTNSEKSITDVIGNKYKTVIIGNQEWMAENLKTTKYNDGTPLPLVVDNNLWNSSSTPAYCWYKKDKNSFYLVPKGALYNWHTVSTGKLCPTGWHVPNNNDWQLLASFVSKNKHTGAKGNGGSWTAIGYYLKDTANWIDSGNGTNFFGFSGIPEGYRNSEGWFFDIGYIGWFWSTTSEDETNAKYFELKNNVDYLFEQETNKSSGLSVRCIKNK